MQWYWLFVISGAGVNKNSHRFQAADNDHAMREARTWVKEHIGFNITELAVAKEIFFEKP